MTTPIDPTSLLTGGSTATSGTTKSQNELDKNTFLKLLVAQIQNQDPSNPMDSTQYMSQMAQFSQVEALNNLQDSFDAQTSYYQSQVASSMLGRNVQVTADGGETYTTGVVDSVRFTSDGPILSIGDKDYYLSEVSAVATSSDTIGKVPTGKTDEGTNNSGSDSSTT
jgi:flagellar basal-body rod modification protein FlgD